VSRILTAADEPRIVRFLVRGLESASYATGSTGDGNLALQLALTGEFDLLLLDLGVPGRDGFAVLTELRTRRSPLPVIVLTARDTPADIVASLDGGADDYMSKPCWPIPHAVTCSARACGPNSPTLRPSRPQTCSGPAASRNAGAQRWRPRCVPLTCSRCRRCRSFRRRCRTRSGRATPRSPAR
jgi:CheY-like chemotaxis protein